MAQTTSVPKLVLASASPRRRELLSVLGIPFSVSPADIPEEQSPGETAAKLVLRLAEEKSALVACAHSSGMLPAIVIGADTVVAFSKDANAMDTLGKPSNKEHACEMLLRLQGRTHLVLTGFAIYRTIGGKTNLLSSEVCITEVTFCSLNREEISRYVDTGEPLDKAGSYGVQGIGAMFIERISGSYTNVVGLPLAQVAKVLKEKTEFANIPHI